MAKVAKLVYTSFVTRVIVDENATDDEIISVAKYKLHDIIIDEFSENLEKIVDDTECPYVEGENAEDEINENINLLTNGVKVKCFGNEYFVRPYFDVDSSMGGLDVKNFIGERIGSIVGEELPDFEDASSVDNFNQMFENWLVENEK
jgi:hypothetical protein